MAQPLTPEQIKKYGYKSSGDVRRDAIIRRGESIRDQWKRRHETGAISRPTKRHTPVRRHPTKKTSLYYIDKAKTRYKKTQEKISSKIPTLKQISQAGYKFGKERPEFARPTVGSMEFLAKGARKYVPEKTGKAVGESAVEFYKYGQEKPLSLVGHTTAAYAGGAVIGGAARGGSLALRYGAKHAAVRAAKYGTVGRYTGTGIKTGAKAIEPGMGAVGMGYMGKEIHGAGSQKEAIKTMAHMGVGTAGAIKGFKAVGKVHEMYRTRGLTELPSTIMDPAVMAGTKQFPTIKAGQTPKQFFGEFTKKEALLPGETLGKTRGWHLGEEISGKGYTGIRGATIKTMKTGEEFVDVARRTDVPGTYVGPKPSTYFLRTGKAGKAKYSSISEKITEMAKPKDALKRIFGGQEPLEPTAIRFEITGGLGRMPRSVRDIQEKGFYTESSKFLAGPAQKGKAYLTPLAESKFKAGRGKAPEGIEAEVTITPGTALEFTGKKFYFKDPTGHRIPVVQQKTIVDIPGPKIKPIKGKKTTAGKLGKEYDIYDYKVKPYRAPKIYTSGYTPTPRRGDDIVRDVMRSIEERRDDPRRDTRRDDPRRDTRRDDPRRDTRRDDPRRDTRRDDPRRDTRRDDPRRDTRRDDPRRDTRRDDPRRPDPRSPVRPPSHRMPPPPIIPVFKLPDVESGPKKKKEKKKGFKKYDITNPVPDLLSRMMK